MQEAVVPVVVFRAGREAPSTAGKPDIDIKYRSDKFTSRVIGLTVLYRVKQVGAFGNPPIAVRIEAYDGTGAKAKVVGESAVLVSSRDRTAVGAEETGGHEPMVRARLDVERGEVRRAEELGVDGQGADG